MTTRTFTITLDDGDRLMVLTALGYTSMHLLAIGDTGTYRRPITELIARLSMANGHDAPVASDRTPPAQTGTEVARAVLKPPTPVPPQMRDYFAAERNGNIPTVAPKGAHLQLLDIQATKESLDRKHLKVIFKGGKANCFDRELWPYISKQTGNVAVGLWIVEKGDYLNIVGVRA